MSRIHHLLLVLLALVSARTAAAVDGVIEINQARATAGGVTPGDSAGWPVTLSLSGSYRLTGNLTVPANTTAMTITARGVTLDLGGFQVAGPNLCSGVPVTSCTTTNGNPGIVADAPLVVVRNGRVYGMGGQCIKLQGDSSAVDHVAVFDCGDQGIDVRGHSRVTESTSIANYGIGIFMVGGGSAEWNESRGNLSNGILGLGTDDGLFIGNRAFNNGGTGISGSGLATKNVLRSNGGEIGSTIDSLGDNLCDGSLC